MRLKIALLALAMCLLLPAGSALAHKLNVFGYLEDGQIKGEGYFSGGAKAQNVVVEVRDAQGRVLGQAHTDNLGKFSLSAPAGGPPYTVTMATEDGHRGDYTIAADQAASQPSEPAAQTPAAVQPAAPEGKAPDARLDAINSRLGAINARLDAINERMDRVGFKDVFAGLGWIVGLLGVAMAFGRRNKS